MVLCVSFYFYLFLLLCSSVGGLIVGWGPSSNFWLMRSVRKLIDSILFCRRRRSGFSAFGEIRCAYFATVALFLVEACLLFRTGSDIFLPNGGFLLLDFSRRSGFDGLAVAFLWQKLY